MSRTLARHRRAGRCRPGVEGLDARLVLSSTATPSGVLSLTVASVTAPQQTSPAATGASLEIMNVTPAPGSVGRGQVTAIAVTFDRPIDPFSISGFDDIRIERLDGSQWQRAYGDFEMPIAELDPTGTTLQLTLASALSQGEYRIVLPAWSAIAGSDGATVADPSEDLVLGTFRVDSPGIGLDDALDLGEIGSSPSLIAGTLDFAAEAAQVRLYRITVPEGHRWRLGAEISAQRDGSTLRATLALFDAQGQLIKAANLGRPDAPADPYLFAGISPGVYYLGVSGSINVPGAPGGYDPAAATPGAESDPATGGAFRLTLVADPADEAVKVVGLGLQWADPTRTSPTGLSLTFSGALDARALSANPSGLVEVVGSDGRVRLLTLVGLNEAGARYYFLFNEPLPAGRYQVRMAGTGGLVDLSGLTPVAPGLPAGVLGSFKVAESWQGGLGVDDLGPLYEEIQDGISRDVAVLPGTGVTYRFVAVTGGLFRISVPNAAGPVVLNLIGPEGLITRPLTSTAPGFVTLKAGVHYLQFANLGGVPLRFRWEMKMNTLWDSLLENGVGQGPALSLRLVTPSGLGESTAPAGAILGPSSTAAGDLGPTGPFGSTPGAAGLNASPGAGVATPSGLLWTFAGTPVGMPNAQSSHVEAVGPGSTAMASAASAVPQGIGYGQSILPSDQASPDFWDDSAPLPKPPVPSRESPGPADRDEEVETAALPEEAAPVNGAVMVKAAAPTLEADARAIAAADWLSNLGAMAARIMAIDFERNSVASDPFASLTGPMLARGDEPLPSSAGRVEKADVSTPLVVGLGAMLAARYSPAIRAWAGRRRQGPVAATKASSAGPYRGPHRRV